MMQSTVLRKQAGLTLIELLCVATIILVLAGLVLGPASHALQRVRADKWADEVPNRLRAVTEQLQKHFRDKSDFPAVTLQQLEAEKLVSTFTLDFLKDRRVTFIPFAGSDSDEKIVLRVALERGFLTDPGVLTQTKGDITRPPE